MTTHYQITLAIAIVALLMSLYNLSTKAKANKKVNTNNTRLKTIKDNHYYLYQYIKKTLKDMGIDTVTIKPTSSEEYLITKSKIGEDNIKTLYDIRSWLTHNMETNKNKNIIVYIDKKLKTIELIKYPKSQKLDIKNSNLDTQIHHKGNFTIITKK